MNIDNNFTDYIKEDMWHASDSSSMDVCTPQDLLFPCPPTFNVDVDILILLAQDEIHTVEQQIRGEWGRSQWGSNISEYDPVIGRPESHWEAVETGFHHNSWETNLTTSPDSCAMDWSYSGLRHEPSPNIPDYTFPICGLYPPASHQQPTEPSVNGPPLVRTNNYKQGLHWGTLHATETSRTDALRARMTGDITGDVFAPSRAVGLPSVPPLPEMHLNRETECQSSQRSGTCPTLPSTTRTDSFSAELSLHGSGMKSSVSTPLHLPEISQVALPPATTKTQRKASERVLRKRTPPRCQTSPPEDVADCKATPGTPRSRTSTFGNQSCISEVKYSRKRSSPPVDKCSPSKTTGSMQQRNRKRRSPSKSVSLTSRILLTKLGFVVNQKDIRCPCGESFTRGWDAGRHWRSATIHKAQRQNSGDFSDSILNLCPMCGEVLSRRDSLKRHGPKCGQRKKRRIQNGWNPKALGKQPKRKATSKRRSVRLN